MSRSSSHYSWRGVPKRAYVDKADALVHASELYERDGQETSVYECWCKRWHVGHEKLEKNAKFSGTEHRLVGKLIGVLRQPFVSQPPKKEEL